MFRRRKNSSGFTFVELLAAAVLTAIISLGVISSFQAGMKVWKRVSNPSTSHRKTVLGLEKFFKELRSMAGYNNSPFKFFGKSDRLSFVNIHDDNIYLIEYSYRDGCLYRSSLTKQQAAGGQSPELRKIISGVKSLAFTYAGWYFTRRFTVEYSDGSFWKTRWGAPSIVRMDLVLEDGSHFERDILIPMGNSGYWIWTR